MFKLSALIATWLSDNIAISEFVYFLFIICQSFSVNSSKSLAKSFATRHISRWAEYILFVCHTHLFPLPYYPQTVSVPGYVVQWLLQSTSFFYLSPRWITYLGTSGSKCVTYAYIALTLPPLLFESDTLLTFDFIEETNFFYEIFLCGHNLKKIKTKMKFAMISFFSLNVFFSNTMSLFQKNPVNRFFPCTFHLYLYKIQKKKYQMPIYIIYLRYITLGRFAAASHESS